MHWLDLHAHLDKLEEGPHAAVEKALASGVHRIFTIGTDEKDLPVVLKLSQDFAPYVYCTLGIHPHDGGTFNAAIKEFMLQNLDHPRCVAVGEIGLDYYYEHSPKEVQQEVFNEQMDIAQQKSLPVQIHTRDAEADTKEILKKYQGRVKGVIHCFTGTQDLAFAALDCGYNISISGVVTFKNAEALRSTVKAIPLDRLHIETDSPFLTPVPHRGKPNSPFYLPHTAQVVADLKSVSLEELEAQCWQNALELFPKMKLQES